MPLEHSHDVRPREHSPSSHRAHSVQAHEGVAAAGVIVSHHEHGGHEADRAAGRHDKHAGHSVEMFRQKFWGTLVLSIPTIIWAPMIQHWFHYEAPGGPRVSRWLPAIFGTAV